MIRTSHRGGEGRGAPVLVRLFLLAASITAFTPRQVAAHGGGPGLSYDACAQSIGPEEYVHFSAYQPAFNRFAEYCRSVPRSGPTLLVFDIVADHLDSTTVALDIVKERGAYHLAVAPQRSASGVIDLQANLESGEYGILLTIASGRAVSHLHFELAVSAWWRPLIAPIIICAIILAAAIVYCLFQARQRGYTAAPRKPFSSVNPQAPALACT